MSVYKEQESSRSNIRDLPVLLRHLVHYLFSGEGLHLAFQLRFSKLSNLTSVNDLNLRNLDTFGNIKI